MNDQYVKNVIEAALLAAGRPLTMDELVSVFDERDGSNAEEVRGAIAALTADYETRGLELLEVASGYRIQIKPSVAQPVSRLWQERPAKYSRALLETLALVAYRQPITRGEIEQIRGVAVNPNIVKTLLERGWIRVVGHRDVPGKPELLSTTREFLDYFSLKKLDDLPTLAQLKELEDLRVQLTLPGADPEVAAPAEAGAEAVAGTDTGAGGEVHAGGSDGTGTEAGAEAAADVSNDDDEEQETEGAQDADGTRDADDMHDGDGAQDSDGAAPRHGLVASGPQDDPN
jgi:segregation and condensation protein B